MSSEAAPQWATSMQLAIVEANKLELRKELGPLKKDIGDCKERLTNVESKQDQMDKRLKSLENGLQSSSSFNPSYVDIKGWCDYDQVKEKGVTRTLAIETLQNLVALLPQELKQHVKDIKL